MHIEHLMSDVSWLFPTIVPTGNMSEPGLSSETNAGGVTFSYKNKKKRPVNPAWRGQRKVFMCLSAADGFYISILLFSGWPQLILALCLLGDPGTNGPKGRDDNYREQTIFSQPPHNIPSQNFIQAAQPSLGSKCQ